MRISDWSSDVCSSDLRSISGACRSGSREPPARPVPQPDKFGADWEVFDSLRLRGTYGTGFRIPNVPELFGGVAEGNLTTTDPCSNYPASGNSVLIENCRASGVRPDYVQLGTSVLTTVGGNEDLEPESSKTWTIGAVFEPEFVPGLSLTADWFNIDIKDAIRAIPGSTKLAVCYNTPNLAQIGRAHV